MIKNLQNSYIRAFFLVLLFTTFPLFASDIKIQEGNWELNYKSSTGAIDYFYAENKVLSDVFAKTKIDNTEIVSKDYDAPSVSQEIINDNFGDGVKYTLNYTANNGLLDISQLFYFYDDKDYFLTEVYINSNTNISSNYIAPVVSTTTSSFLPRNASNRVLSVPFDNDGWVRYSSSPLTVDTLSFGVTAFFNGDSRKGLIIGSVEHDTWKTGIRFSTSSNQHINKLECFGGVTHKLTRDHNVGCNNCEKTTLEHGYISGRSLKSPKVLVALVDDWRRGMETYGEANVLVASKRSWDKGTPFGWNSWGGMEKQVNYQGSRDVSDFIKKELQPKGFENEGVTYIGLDSFWDINFSDGDLMNFVKSCRQRGQEAGIYWTPFSDWNHNGDRYIEGTDGMYKYKDAYLYANGKVRSIAGLALDPTHPGVKMRIKEQIADFKKWGFKYIKLDFLNNGTQEADSFFEPGVTTGMQAYNHGMQYLVEQCGDDFFLALSIAPTFPSQYGHSKRISCDVWGAMNDVYNWTGSTEYLLNSLSFGWWLDRVYPFNDPDHIVLYDEASNRRYSESENRARITSAVITGLYMLGDNLSLKGSFPGSQTARDRVLQFATNQDINDIAKYQQSFAPVYGFKASGNDRAESFFTLDTEHYLYLAVFNFNAYVPLSGELPLSHLNANPTDFSGIKELWTGKEIRLRDNIEYDIPTKDTRVYRLTKQSSGVENKKKADSVLKHYLKDNFLIVKSEDGINTIQIISVEGKNMLNKNFDSYENMAELNMANLSSGVYFLNVSLENGQKAFLKFIR